jgi:hypothetical protein
MQLRHSCGHGHARLGHFLLDVGAGRDFEPGLFFSSQDANSMT